MAQCGNIANPADEQSGAAEPLSEIELNVFKHLVNGASLSEVAAKTGYSEFVIAAVLKGIQEKTDSNNLVQATIVLMKMGTLKA